MLREGLLYLSLELMFISTLEVVSHTHNDIACLPFKQMQWHSAVLILVLVLVQSTWTMLPALAVRIT